MELVFSNSLYFLLKKKQLLRLKMLNIYIWRQRWTYCIYFILIKYIVIYYLSFLYNNIKNNTSMKSQVSWESQHWFKLSVDYVI